MNEHLTLNALHKSRKIWWIRSIQTLRKWVEEDMEKNNTLKTITVGKGNKKRYYFKEENVDNYINEFTENKKTK